MEALLVSEEERKIIGQQILNTKHFHQLAVKIAKIKLHAVLFSDCLAKIVFLTFYEQ